MQPRTSVEKISTMQEMLNHIEHGFQNPAALNTYNNGVWEKTSTSQLCAAVKCIALALNSIGVKKGDKIGIMGPPSSRWTVADLAIMSIGAVSVPLFTAISEDNLQYEIEQAEITTCFIGGAEAWAKYHNQKHLFSNVISLDIVDSNMESFDAFLAKGEVIDKQNPALFTDLNSQLQPEDLATIIYTSGTTGLPKGVMHSQRSLLANVLINEFNWNAEEDRYLSFLPVAHVFARIINLIAIAWSISIYYYNDMKTLAAACQEVHPTVMIVVPRILEKMYSAMVAKLHKQTYLKRTIGQFAFNLANQDHETIWTQLFHPIAEKLVYSHLREALGSKLRIVISGSAPLDPHLYYFFLHIGIPLIEGYGATEACPVTSNRGVDVKIGSVGKTIPQVEAKVDQRGELLVKGNCVMQGYFKNPEATKAVLDSEGWFHTGDQATIDSQGFVTITGRLKELLKTSTGETIAPVPIEHALMKIPFIELAMVVAEKKKFATCLLIPNLDVLHALKAEHNASQLSDELFLQSEYIKEEMDKFLVSVNAHLNHWEQIRDYRFIPHELSTVKGELTPTMKIVRDVVEERYQGLIDSMYKDEL